MADAVSPPRTPLFLDDLVAGQRFLTGPYYLSTEEATRFARDYDPQPFHLDEEAARQSIFGGLSVSGWYTAAVSMRLFVTEGPQIASGKVGLGGEISWPRPTRPGDTLRVQMEILEVTPSRSKPDRGIVTFRNQTFNQRDEVVQTFVGKMIVPRRPAAGS